MGFFITLYDTLFILFLSFQLFNLQLNEIDKNKRRKLNKSDKTQRSSEESPRINISENENNNEEMKKLNDFIKRSDPKYKRSNKDYQKIPLKFNDLIEKLEKEVDKQTDKLWISNYWNKYVSDINDNSSQSQSVQHINMAFSMLFSGHCFNEVMAGLTEEEKKLLKITWKDISCNIPDTVTHAQLKYIMDFFNNSSSNKHYAGNPMNFSPSSLQTKL